MVHLARGFRQAILLLVLATGILVSAENPSVEPQASEDLTSLTREAFTQIAEVYRLGGDAPELVAKLNRALELTDQARLKRFEGDEASAAKLEEQARVAILQIMNDVPDARERAEYHSVIKTVTMFVLVPAVVALSTIIFYAGLRTWRWYEKGKLFEMRIVAKKKED